MEDIKAKISKMDDSELKRNIISYNDKKLNSINKSSYLNAFSAIITVVEALEKKDEIKYLKELSETRLFKEYTDTAVRLLKSSTYERDFSKNLEIAKNKRKEIYDLLQIVGGYFTELSYVGNSIDYYGLKIKAKDYKTDSGPVNIESIIRLIDDTLEKYKDDYSVYEHIISQIIQFIPMRLTKDKYIDIVEKTIKRNLIGRNKAYVKNKIEYYKAQWDSSMRYGYGLKFDRYFAQIQKIKNEDLKGKDIQALDEMVGEVIPLTKDVNELYNFILILGLIYNMIIIIYSLENISLDEDILELMDIWKDALKSNDTNKTLEVIKVNASKLNEIEEDISIDIDVFEALNREALRRKILLNGELKEVYENTSDILAYYRDQTLENIDLILSKDNKPASEDYLDEWVNSLTSYIKRSLKNMNVGDRKVRMKKFLSLLELPFSSVVEFEDYIRYALNSNTSFSNETQFTVNNIISFIKAVNSENKD